jgi:hypothetical protein
MKTITATADGETRNIGSHGPRFCRRELAFRNARAELVSKSGGAIEYFDWPLLIDSTPSYAESVTALLLRADSRIAVAMVTDFSPSSPVAKGQPWP